MRLILSPLRPLRGLLNREALDRELDDEIRSHLEMRTEQLIGDGMAPDEARRAARRAFGGVLRIREETRATWGVVLLESVAQDLRHAVRTLRKTSLLSAVGVLSLALGIGVSAGIWTLFNGAMLRPPPLYQDPDRLVTIWETPPREPGELRPVSTPIYSALAQQTEIFEGVSIARVLSGVSVRIENYPIAVSAKAASPNLMPTLGVQPEIGRNFSEEETEPVVILSRRLWETRFDPSDEVIGKLIFVNGVAHTVIGVMPRRFWFADTSTDIWLPLHLDAEPVNAEQRDLLAVARLRPGVGIAQARARLPGILAQASESNPEREKEWALRLEDLVRTRLLRTDIPPGIWLIAGMMCVGMLIACVNIANVVVGRSIDRGKEMAVRAVLGAGRLRLARQFLTESLLLAATGATLAAPVAWATMQLVFRGGAPDLPICYDFPFDARIAGFLAAVVLLTGIGAGLAPALIQSKVNADAALKQASRTATVERQFLRRLLVVSEIGLTLALVIISAGLWRNYHEILRRAPGFEMKNLMSVRLALSEAKYSGSGAGGSRVAGFLEEAARRLGTMPNITSVAAIGAPPFWDGAVNLHSFEIRGEPAAASDASRIAACNPVSADYFQTLGIPLLRGRPISALDDKRAPLVVWINESMAQRFWPGTNPVGTSLTLNDDDRAPRLVAGVVGDTRNQTIMGEPAPALYMPYRQYPASWEGALLRPTILLRTAASLDQAASDVRSAIAAIDPDQAVSAVGLVERHVQGAASEVLLGVLLPGPLIALGLLMSALGVYGVLAFAVRRRTREIGIRMALGARREDVLGMLLREGLRLTAAGVTFGVIAGGVITRGYAGPLESAGVTVFAVASGLLLLVGTAASYVPTRRVLRMEPASALHYE